MSYITLKCKSCGADMSLSHDSKAVTCKHCGSTYMMIDLLDDVDKLFTQQLSKKDVENMIEFSDAIKKGETYIYQAEYTLAEESFKKAIEYNDKSHKGYFGVVKAKTANFNKIPDETDYLEYAKLALKYVDKDDEAFVKSEISKLDFLATEKKLQLKEQKQKDTENELHEKNKRANDKFFSQVTFMLIFLFTAVVLLTIYITKATSIPDPQNTSKTTYEVSTLAQLKAYAEKPNFLSSTIIIKDNIDFDNENWTPIGTSDKPFTGIIQGNNHILSNFTITSKRDEGFNAVGFVGYAKNATINGLIFSNVTINDEYSSTHQTTNYFGIVAGYLENTSISKCEVESTCEIKIIHQYKSSFMVGGMVGNLSNGRIVYSYSNAKVSATITDALHNYPTTNLSYSVGGLVGSAKNAKINNTYSSGIISSSVSAQGEQTLTVSTAGLIGRFELTSTSANLSNNFFAGTVRMFISSSAEHTSSFLAGIVGYGENSNYMRNNFAINKDDAYKLNSSSLKPTDLHDSANSNIVQYLTEINLKVRINIIFPDSVWNKTNMLTPTIKVA